MNNTELEATLNIIHNKKYSYILDSEEYKSHDKISIICSVHGKFHQRLDHHREGHGCKRCAFDSGGENKRNGLQWFLKKSIKIHGDRYDYSLFLYTVLANKGIIICKKHGEFSQHANNHIKGHGCPRCKFEELANKYRKSTEAFITDANKVHKNVYDYSKYIYQNSRTSSIVICNKHGEFTQCPISHLRGSGCPRCKKSLGEMLIRKFLVENNIEFITQHKFDDCRRKRPLPFDFYLPNKNLVIEYQGQQHYKSVSYWGGEKSFIYRQENDRIKRDYCLENDIYFLEIRYDDQEMLLKLHNVISANGVI